MKIILAITCLSLSSSLFAGPALDSLVKEAKDKNPMIISARERMYAADSRVLVERTLDNPKFIAEYWSIPDSDALNLGAAMEKMYGISQMIPFPGKLSLRGKAARYEAEVTRAEYEIIIRDVVSGLKSAYGEYYSLQKTIDTYNQMKDIMKTISGTAQGRYTAGKSPQSDMLLSQVESEKIAAMADALEQEKTALKVSINVFIGSSENAPLDDPEEVKPGAIITSWDDIAKSVSANNPMAGKAGAMAERELIAKQIARAEFLPDFELSYRKKTINDSPYESDFMVGVSVPLWFWRQRSALNEKTHSYEAYRQEKNSTSLDVMRDAKSAYTSLVSARKFIDVYEGSLLPKSEQSLDVATASYRAGTAGFAELLESFHAYLNVKLEYYKYIADYYKSKATLEKISGIEAAQ